jgi:alpha-methylacyl-CoA racemase
MAQGPLSGVKIVEFAGIGPGPFCGMLLSDMGADVIRIDRPGDGRPGRAADVTGRGRRSIGLNLKDPGDIETALKLLPASWNATASARMLSWRAIRTSSTAG